MNNTKQILITVAAFVAGALAIFGINKLSNDDSGLADARAEIAELREKLEGKGRKLTTLPQETPEEIKELITTDAPVEEEVVAVQEEEKPAEADPAEALANLFNSKEARGLMKRMSAGFAQRGEQFIEQGIAEYTEKLNLSDAQVASLKKRLTAQMKEQTDAFNAKLDNDGMSMQEIMAEQREVMMGQEDVMAEILKEELTEDQFAEFEREQLVEKTERVQRDSDRELSRLNRDLELTESQQDQVFGILVQTNSDYDDSMAIEGADASVAVGEDQAKEDAIRSVLDADQAAKYDKSNEERAQRRQGWGGFGGGRGGFGGR